MNNHSPGPWEACDNDGHSLWHIYSTSTNLPIVAAVYGDCAETEENARLIAAAPDMLRVLRVLHANSKWSSLGVGADYIREIIDLILCILFVLTLLGLYTAAAIYLNDPVQPTIPEDVTTDWGNQ